MSGNVKFENHTAAETSQVSAKHLLGNYEIHILREIHPSYMTENLFFITQRSPPLPLPLFQHPMTHDFRLLPEHTHDGFSAHLQRRRSISHRKKRQQKLRRYILWDCHNQLKISCLLHVEASLTYLLDNSTLLPRLGEARTPETQDFFRKLFTCKLVVAAASWENEKVLNYRHKNLCFLKL